MAFLFSFCQMAERFSAMAFSIPASAACEILIFNSRASDKRRVQRERLVAFLPVSEDVWDVVMTGPLLHVETGMNAHDDSVHNAHSCCG